MAKFCMGCGSPLQPGDKFCMRCGKPVEKIEAPGSGAAPGSAAKDGMAIPNAAAAGSMAVPGPSVSSGNPTPPIGFGSSVPQPAVSFADPVPQLVDSKPDAPFGSHGWESAGSLGASVAQPAASAGSNPSWAAPSASQESSWASAAQPSAAFESEADVAATEVWQVSVAKNPSHARPFTMDLPRDEAIDRGFVGEVAPGSDEPDFVNSLNGFAQDPLKEQGEQGHVIVDGTAGAELGVAADVDKAASEGGWQVTSLSTAVEDDDDDESPTIVAQFLGVEDDEEDDSPTVVVIKEHGVLTRQEGGERIEFAPPCIIGRGKASDKRFTGNQTISRRHAKFVKQDGTYLLEDLGSTNGTYVNGTELAQGVPTPVPDGAVVRLGTEDFVFSIESA